MNFNKLILGGNLTRDPELKYTTAGKPVCEFGMAVNRKGKDGKETTMFIDVSTWGTVAENCSKYLKVGSGVLIDGEINYDTWEKDGQKRSKHKATAWGVQFIDKLEQSNNETQVKAEVLDEDIPF